MFKDIVKILASNDDLKFTKLEAIIKQNHGKFMRIVDERVLHGGHTMLTYALDHKLRKCAFVLLKYKANPNTVAENGAQPMVLALGDSEMLLAMLKGGLIVDETNAGDLLAMNDVDILKRIADTGFSLDSPVLIIGIERTPLSYYVEEALTHMVSALLETGVSVDDENARIAVQAVADGDDRFSEIIELFQEHSAKIDAPVDYL
jgi:hypothetical protein